MLCFQPKLLFSEFIETVHGYWFACIDEQFKVHFNKIRLKQDKKFQGKESNSLRSK